MCCLHCHLATLPFLYLQHGELCPYGHCGTVPAARTLSPCLASHHQASALECHLLGPPQEAPIAGSLSALSLFSAECSLSFSARILFAFFLSVFFSWDVSSVFVLFPAVSQLLEQGLAHGRNAVHSRQINDPRNSPIYFSLGILYILPCIKAPLHIFKTLARNSNSAVNIVKWMLFFF